MDSFQIEPARFLGTWRRFGCVGPVYEVIGVAGENPIGERLMRIRVLESGEEVDYRLADLLDDPKEC
jgi:hypothetical protein